MPLPHYTQQQVVQSLGLIPHPEGGYFRETYRSGATPMVSRGQTDPEGTLIPAQSKLQERNTMTSIMYLLGQDCPTQALACNHSPHVHYWHMGAPVANHLLHQDGTYERIVLGPDLLQGHQPQVIVAGGVYKGAQFVEGSGADYALLGEGVAPGFDSRDFAFVSEAELRRRAAGDETSVQALLPFVKPDLKTAATFDSYYD